MTGPQNNVDVEQLPLPEALVDALARVLAEILVLEYRAQIRGELTNDPTTVDSPTGTHRVACETPLTE